MSSTNGRLRQPLQVGAGFWLTDMQLLRAKAEELAKAQYAVRKDPSDAALMYMALGKKLLLQVGIGIA